MNGKRPGGWFAMANRYYRDPKFDLVSESAELLWLHGLAYASEQETDGRVAGSALVALLVPRSKRAEKRAPKRARTCAAELVAAGLWEETDDGFAVPFETWSRWQETAEQRAAGRARAAEKKARQRAVPGGQTGGQLGHQGSGAGAGAVRSTKSPDPSAPLTRPPKAARGALNGQAEDPVRIDVGDVVEGGGVEGGGDGRQVTEEARRANPDYEAARRQYLDGA